MSEQELENVENGKDNGGESSVLDFSTPGRRVGWNTAIRRAACKLRGSTLLAWLFETANDRGLQLKEMAKELGVTYGYIHQLRNGIKPVPGISDEVVDRCAKFLDVPRLAVLVAADIMRFEDFYQEPDSLRTYLEPSLRFIKRDPLWGAFMHPIVFDVDDKVKYFIITLYEEATGRKLIPTKISIEGLMDAMVAKDTDYYKPQEHSAPENESVV